MSYTTGVPAVSHGDNSGTILGNVLEDRLRQVEMVVGRVAPAARRAEVSGSDNNSAWNTPLWVVDTAQLKASATAKAIVK